MAEKTKEQTAKQVTCASCGKLGAKETMVTREGKWYCCDDCADGKGCECGECGE